MITITSESLAERFPAVASSLGAEHLETLLAALEVQEVVPSEALTAEQTPGDDLFLVWDGQLDVSIATPTGERSVGTVGIGSFVGEVALLDPGPVTATVTAEQGCTVLRLSRSNFDDLCDRHPVVAGALLAEMGRTLSARLRQGVNLLGSTLAADRPGAASGPEPERLLAVHTALHHDVRS